MFKLALHLLLAAGGDTRAPLLNLPLEYSRREVRLQLDFDPEAGRFHRFKRYPVVLICFCSQ